MKSKELRFPRWAPPAVIARWREAKDGYPSINGEPSVLARFRRRRADDAGILEKILTNTEMRVVWERLPRITRQDRFSAEDHFASAILTAYMGPWGEQRWTGGQRKAWSRNVNALTERLAKMIERTHADHFLVERYLSPIRPDEVKISEAPVSLRRGAWTPRRMSELLRSFARESESHLASSVLPRPASRSAKRTYFVRYLTKYCINSYGRPERNIVANVTAAVFGDASIDQHKVRRLTASRGQ